MRMGRADAVTLGGALLGIGGVLASIGVTVVGAGLAIAGFLVIIASILWPRPAPPPVTEDPAPDQAPAARESRSG